MTRILEALDYSRPVQPLFAQAAHRGFIHSIFHGALNISVDETLFTLLSAEKPRMPNGARLPGCIMEQLYAKLSPGVEVRVGEGRLMIPAPDLCICLPDRMAWEPVPALAAKSLRQTAAAGHARMLARFLAQRSQQDGLAPLVRPLLLNEAARETPLAHIALPLLRLLLRASREQDWAGVEEAARGLAGLGPGLTPSGDDTLGGFTGVLALIGLQVETSTRKAPARGPTHPSPTPASTINELANRFVFIVEAGADTGTGGVPCGRLSASPSGLRTRKVSAKDRGERTAGQRLAEVIACAARPRTTLLSATLLDHAARGELAEQVGDLLMALALPAAESASVLQAAERVLAYGACSGGDTLLGLLLGLKAAGVDYPIRVPGRPQVSPLPYTKETMRNHFVVEPPDWRSLW